MCYLRKVSGACEGRYDEWFYDSEHRRCAPFVYSGCLGNGNRFLSRRDCEDMCVTEEDRAVAVSSVCDLPRAEGACKGNFSR